MTDKKATLPMKPNGVGNMSFQCQSLNLEIQQSSPFLSSLVSWSLRFLGLRSHNMTRMATTNPRKKREAIPIPIFAARPSSSPSTASANINMRTILSG